MELALSRNINSTRVDGYYGEKQAWFTREQIGTALEYNNPSDAVSKIHRRHKERLDKFAEVVSLSTPGGTQTTYVYNQQGVFEICRWSRQPKADMVMDALYSMATEAIEKGYYSALTTEKLLEVLTEKQRENPKFLESIDKQAIKSQVFHEKRKNAETQCSLLFLERGKYSREEYRAKLKAICDGDQTLFRKEWDWYMCK